LYIHNREYVKFVVKYFQQFEPHILKKIKIIRRIGIEFFGKNKDYKVNVSIQEDLNILEFINEAFDSSNGQNKQEEEKAEEFLGKKRKTITTIKSLKSIKKCKKRKINQSR
jgi:hypothetical protein